MRPEPTPPTAPEEVGAATPTTRDDKVDDIAVSFRREYYSITLWCDGRSARKVSRRSIPRAGNWKLKVRSRPRLRNDITARFAAGFAVIEAILTQADFHQRLTEAAILFAVAPVFRHLALHAAVLPVCGGSGHGRTVARPAGKRKVPLVTGARGARLRRTTTQGLSAALGMRGWLRLLLHRLRAKRDGASLRLMAVRRDLEIRRPRI